MGGEVDERDLLARTRGGHAGDVLGDAIVEGDLAAADHLGEQSCREGLGHRSDLEPGARVERTIGPGRSPGSLGAALGLDQDRDRAADAPGDQAGDRREARIARPFLGAGAPGDDEPVHEAD